MRAMSFDVASPVATRASSADVSESSGFGAAVAGTAASANAVSASRCVHTNASNWRRLASRAKLAAATARQCHRAPPATRFLPQA